MGFQMMRSLKLIVLVCLIFPRFLSSPMVSNYIWIQRGSFWLHRVEKDGFGIQFICHRPQIQKKIKNKINCQRWDFWTVEHNRLGIPPQNPTMQKQTKCSVVVEFIPVSDFCNRDCYQQLFAANMKEKFSSRP